MICCAGSIFACAHQTTFSPTDSTIICWHAVWHALNQGNRKRSRALARTPFLVRTISRIRYRHCARLCIPPILKLSDAPLHSHTNRHRRYSKKHRYIATPCTSLHFSAPLRICPPCTRSTTSSADSCPPHGRHHPRTLCTANALRKRYHNDGRLYDGLGRPVGTAAKNASRALRRRLPIFLQVLTRKVNRAYLRQCKHGISVLPSCQGKCPVNCARSVYRAPCPLRRHQYTFAISAGMRR